MEIQKTFSAYDAESNDIVWFTQDQVKEAKELDQRLREKVGEMAALIARVVDQKLHLALGFTTITEYFTSISVNERSGYRLLNIGRKLNLSLPASTDHVVSNVDLVNDIGLRKADALASIEDADFAEIVETGLVTLPSGKKMSLDEIRATNWKDFEKQMRAEKKLYKERLELLDEENKLLRAEAESAKMEIEQAKTAKKIADDIYRRFGPAENTLRKWYSHLNAARTHLQSMNQELYKIEVDHTVDEAFANELWTFHKELDRAMQNLRDRNIYAFGGAYAKDVEQEDEHELN